MGLGTTATIVGIGETPIGNHAGKTALQLQAEAALSAIQDAQIQPHDIDGVLSIYTRTESWLMPSVALAEYLGLSPTHSYTSVMGGAAGASLVSHAAMCINSGLCHNVLIVGGENRLTGLAKEDNIERMAGIGHPDFEAVYGPLVPAFYALIANRYCHEYGLTPEQLAFVPIIMREHAHMNPNAYKRDLISLSDVLSSKMIASPLHLLECAVIADGAGALVVVSQERAKDFPKPVTLIGFGEKFTHEHLISASSLTSFGVHSSGQQALAMAGVSISNIDVAELYDCFSITLLIELEELGFCERGESGQFVEQGQIRLHGGRIPVNTHGGLLSHGQPGASGGLFHVIEAVRQLRGECGDRQVSNAELALVHGNSGVMSGHSTLILAKGGA